ncbi:MAG: hypothetical protein HOP30_13470, partial [Cyclobacteriaceae bacterium]|nr:hypothetical protein [Cyclobacteriaceae bacterium]
MLAANNFCFSISRGRFSALPIHLLFVFFLSVLSSCAQPKKEYTLIIRNGMICDGSGNKPYQGDVAIQGDTLAAMGITLNS